MVNKIYTFRAIIEPDKPSGYHGFVPSLPGCHTAGDTIEETKEHLKEAMAGILECMIENDVLIPQEDNSVEFIHPPRSPGKTFSPSKQKCRRY